MEGLVLSATAFMSFASILWLVVAKLATGNEDEASETASANNDEDEAPHTLTKVTTSIPIEKKRMSRRQRKNVKKREKDSSCSESSNNHNPTTKSASASNLLPSLPETCLSSSKAKGNVQTTSSSPVSTPKGPQKKRSGFHSRHYVSLGLSDDQIYFHLLNYILEQNTLRSLGYPLESQLSPGKAVVYQDPDFRGGSANFSFFDDEPAKSASISSLDANAREFVPKSLNLDDEAAASGDEVASTHSSNSLSASAKEFVPRTDLEDPYYEARTCGRCNKLFYIFKETGECVNREECVYHWGKARSSRKYSCCGRRSGGCETAHTHVWRGMLYDVPGQHKDLDGFAKTRPPRNRAQPSDGNYGVYGLDGEMVFTTNGLQLCKITVVGIDGRLVYETFVRPDDTIIDYNTRFSGVSARDLKRGPVKTLKDVQNDLLGFINANTILIGHGLENDLRALKLVHMTVIDTSLVFPHYYGMPFRRSLKSIVHSYLKREIQAENCGHDSYEDARSCVELMLWKVRQDFPANSSTSNSSSTSITTTTTEASSTSSSSSRAVPILSLSSSKVSKSGGSFTSFPPATY